MPTKTIEDIDVSGKTVLMRVDFNVPIKDGKVTNDKRIVGALPSIRKVLEGGGMLVLMSHCGRPAGKGFETEFSNKPAAERLSQLLGRSVKVGSGDVGGAEDVAAVQSLRPGDVKAVASGIDDGVDPHFVPHVLEVPAADDPQRAIPGELDHRLPHVFLQDCPVGCLHDGGQRPVIVQEHGNALFPGLPGNSFKVVQGGGERFRSFKTPRDGNLGEVGNGHMGSAFQQGFF